ncbi:MAG: hypothetical protein K6B65_02515 [Bacilli bacterium]|nr:hypothetical protein [Bacilli bacterium]
MKEEKKSINSPDDLDKNLRYNSPLTWVVLSLVGVLLIGFFTWACVAKVEVKVSGTAEIREQTVTLHVDRFKSNILEKGQKVYIAELEGEILSVNDGVPVVSSFALPDGEYDYYIALGEIAPIRFLF